MKIAYRLRVVPLLAGIAVTLIGGVRYAGAALPYPDPTPQLLAGQALQLSAARALIIAGLALAAVGVVWLVFAQWRGASGRNRT